MDKLYTLVKGIAAACKSYFPPHILLMGVKLAEKPQGVRRGGQGRITVYIDYAVKDEPKDAEAKTRG